MPDPFDQLVDAFPATQPDLAFSTRLRDRLARALNLPKGVPVTRLTLEEPLPPAATGAVITPYLAVSGAQDALRWYQDALGARLLGDPIVMPDGRIGHAELDLGGARLMLSEEHLEIGVSAPHPGEPVPVTLHLEVQRVDETIQRALAAGAREERATATHEYGRNGVIRDPFGHRWLISGSSSTPSIEERQFQQGDIGYVSLWVPDLARATTFFSTVLGWTYGPASGPQGRQVEGRGVHHGLWSAEGYSTLFLCFAVGDLATAVARVRSSGGTAGEPHLEPYGLIADCTDDQGIRFALFEPPSGLTGGAPRLPNGARHGDLAYVTMEVVDSDGARAFYGEVLGWRFSAGRATDGWQVDDVAPMVGLSGGHETATTVPMYRVDDIAATVALVREAGGRSTEPEVQPYGITADCRDDQGTRFYLGQL
jgi:uncharacterized glyoxalase superfamily protein PhnB/predicted enzyme related to lactoylglutathione lyase